MKLRGLSALFVVSLVVFLGFLSVTTSDVTAQECNIDLVMSPGGPYVKGVEVWISGTGNCTTVKWRVNGDTKEEYPGIPDLNHGYTWRTDQSQFPPGEYQICMLGRVTSSWDNADEECRSVTLLASGPGANPGLDGCRVLSFSVTPQSNHIDGDFSLTGVGECGPSGDFKVKFRMGGRVIYEGNGTSATHMWKPEYTGGPSACFIISRGDWYDQDDTAEACVEIRITDSGSQPDPNSAEAQHTSSPSNSGGSNNNGSGNNGGGNNGGGSSAPSGQCNSISQLRVRDIAVVNTGEFARLRQDHTTESAMLIRVPRGTKISIVSGPYCSGRYVWWQSQYGGHTGWIAEINGSNDRNLIKDGQPMTGGNNGGGGSSEPSQPSQPSNPGSNQSCEGANPVTIAVGERGRVANRNERTRLWTEPQGDVISEDLGNGREFTVIGGPVCSWGHQGNLWWSQVQVDGVNRSGWVSYGYGFQAPWVEPGLAIFQESPDLGRMCHDNANGTVTCRALGVNTDTNNSKDPYAGVFEMPPGAASRVVEIRFQNRGITLTGDTICALLQDGFVDSSSGGRWNALPGFELNQGCVQAIEIGIGSGRENPAYWTLTYRK